MNKPSIKNFILIGIPTVISGLGVIMALDILEKYKNTIIFITFILLIVFIVLLLYYSKQEVETKNEIEKLKNTISSMSKVIGVNSKIVVSFVGLLENWNRNINKIVHDIRKDGLANEKDWDYEKICTDVCICCKDSIVKFTEIDDETDISVSFIKYYTVGDDERIRMIAHSSPQTARPDVYDKEEALRECMYQYARLIRDKNRDIFVLENTEKIQQCFYKKKPDTDLTKYSQYIAIPVICSKNKFLGILQVTTKYNYKIMNTDVELKKFSETYITPFVDLIILVDKIEKGLFVKPASSDIRRRVYGKKI